jgi:hypothetical protein
MRIRSASLLLVLSLICTNVFAQKNVTTVGIQYKPIFPFNFLGTGKQSNDGGGVHFDTELASGFSGGLFIRHNFSDLVGLEGGINYVKRKYNLTITDGGFSEKTIFRIVGYEIPVSAVIYARIGEKLYANGSLGPSLDMFASDIITFGTYFRNNAVRRSTFQAAVNANLGFEYRTEKSGSFYIGASYHRPFSYIYAQATEYKQNGKDETVFNSLVGNYLTIDLRYFFHEDPANKKKKS